MRPGKDLTAHLSGLTAALERLVAAQTASTEALRAIGREQHVTNLIVRAQLTTDPATKERLLAEAVVRMDVPRRKEPHVPGTWGDSQTQPDPTVARHGRSSATGSQGLPN